MQLPETEAQRFVKVRANGTWSIVESPSSSRSYRSCRAIDDNPGGRCRPVHPSGRRRRQRRRRCLAPGKTESPRSGRSVLSTVSSETIGGGHGTRVAWLRHATRIPRTRHSGIRSRVAGGTNDGDGDADAVAPTLASTLFVTALRHVLSIILRRPSLSRSRFLFFSCSRDHPPTHPPILAAPLTLDRCNPHRPRRKRESCAG